jgi:RNA polymerase sigma factor (sigma-70 family)
MSNVACQSLPPTSYTLLLALRDSDASNAPDRRDRLEVEFRAIYTPVVDGWCQRWIPRGDDAVCAATAIMDKVIKELRQYDRKRGHFRSWLKTVVQRAAIDWLRRHPILAAGSFSWVEAVCSPNSEVAFDVELERSPHHRQLELYERAASAVRARVEPQTWVIFDRRMVRNEPYDVVARELCVKPSVLHQSVHRVLKMLQQEVRRLESASGDGPGDRS